MSRVDEALRRALEQGPNAGPVLSGDRPSQVADLDIDTLAQEPFPIEMREHRRPRKPVAENPPSPVPVHSSLPVVQEATSAELFERVNVALAEKIVIDHNMAPVCREQYRRLAAILHHSQLSTGLSVVMVSSAVPGEGKTLTSANLALTFSESYHRNVLLIDADLRRPALHSVFRVDNTSGLSDGLAAEQEHKMALRQVSPRLAILPAGKATSDPMARLTSDRMRRLLQEARGSFDWVIIDTPPVALLPDAHLLTSMTDGALLVVKAGSTPHYLVKRAMEALGQDRILGAVLNRSTTSTNAGGYGYYQNYYYGASPEIAAKS
jgi:capsular exopolysaccharide synthesis family protein